MRYIFSLFLLLCSSYITSARHDDYTTKIDSLIRTSSIRPFSGVVWIGQKGKVKYARAYGYADTAGKRALKTNDQFVILSNTKQITAVVVLQEADKGHLDLNTPIRKYLPELKQSWADTVTIHQLLNHTSGVVVEDMPLAFKAGSRFQYSNFGYSLLARIASRTSGKSYEALVTELFRKCGMKKTVFPSDSSRYALVAGTEHLKDNTLKPVTDVIFGREEIPFGGLVSTAGDLALWNDRLHHGKLLRPETYKLMTSYTVKNQHPVFGDKEVGYGYGIRINDGDNIREYGHTGYAAQQGFTAVNLYYPGSGISVIILENQAYDDFDIAYYFETAIRNIVRNSGLLQAGGR